MALSTPAAIWLSDHTDGLPPDLALPTKPFAPEEHPFLAEHRDALLQIVPELPAPRRVLAAHEGFGETHPLYYRGKS